MHPGDTYTVEILSAEECPVAVLGGAISALSVSHTKLLAQLDTQRSVEVRLSNTHCRGCVELQVTVQREKFDVGKMGHTEEENPKKHKTVMAALRDKFQRKRSTAWTVTNDVQIVLKQVILPMEHVASVLLQG